MSANGNGREERRLRAGELRSSGLTQPEIADRLGVSTATVWRYLNGRSASKGREFARDRRDALVEVRREVEQQVAFDSGRISPLAALAARIVGVRDAQRAVLAGEEWAREGLRGALVDIASAAMVSAAEIEADSAEFEEAELAGRV